MGARALSVLLLMGHLEITDQINICLTLHCPPPGWGFRGFTCQRLCTINPSVRPVKKERGHCEIALNLCVLEGSWTSGVLDSYLENQHQLVSSRGQSSTGICQEPDVLVFPVYNPLTISTEEKNLPHGIMVMITWENAWSLLTQFQVQLALSTNHSWGWCFTSC